MRSSRRARTRARPARTRCGPLLRRSEGRTHRRLRPGSRFARIPTIGGTIPVSANTARKCTRAQLESSRCCCSSRGRRGKFLRVVCSSAARRRAHTRRSSSRSRSRIGLPVPRGRCTRRRGRRARSRCGSQRRTRRCLRCHMRSSRDRSRRRRRGGSRSTTVAGALGGAVAARSAGYRAATSTR